MLERRTRARTEGSVRVMLNPVIIVPELGLPMPWVQIEDAYFFVTFLMPMERR